MPLTDMSICMTSVGTGKFGLVAQLVEPPAHNRIVVGSSPTKPICWSVSVGQLLQQVLWPGWSLSFTTTAPVGVELPEQILHVLFASAEA